MQETLLKAVQEFLTICLYSSYRMPILYGSTAASPKFCTHAEDDDV